MSWLIWLFAGAAFGWWAHVLFGGAGAARPPEPDRRLRREPDENATLAFYLGFMAGILSGQPAPGELTELQRNRRIAIWLVLLAGALICAALIYFDALGSSFYAIQGFLLSPRILALTGGAAVGFWASAHRRPIVARLGDFYKALLGSETHSSWALQAAVALLALFAIVVAFKPDLLEHIESLKAGEVEAKFSSVSTTTREAGRVVLNTFHRDVTIDQWVNFKKSFRGSSPRQRVIDLFDHSTAKDPRTDIRNDLFQDYIEPLAIVLACLNKNDRLEEVRRSEGMAALAADWRAHILGEAENGKGAFFSIREWQALLRRTDEQIAKTSGILRELPDPSVRACEKYDPDPEDKNGNTIPAILAGVANRASLRDREAERLSGLVIEAIAELQSEPSEKSYKLSYIDPYVIGVIGDLLSMSMGPSEKTDFLARAKRGYPIEMDLINPGLINIYYQLADSKNQVETPWPLGERMDELDQAMRGVDFIIAETRKAARRRASPKSLTADESAAILRVYFINKLVFTKTYLETYFQRSLAGTALLEQDRVRWRSRFREAEAVLNLGGVTATLTLPEVAPRTISAGDAPEWKTALEDIAENHAPHLFDARIAMALSSVILTEDRNHRASEQACSIARFHLAEARRVAEEMRRRPPRLNDAEISRLRGYVFQIETRIGASC